MNTGAWQFASGLVTVTLVAEILPFMIMPSFSVTAARPSMLPTDEEDTAGDWVPPDVPVRVCAHVRMCACACVCASVSQRVFLNACAFVRTCL